MSKMLQRYFSYTNDSEPIPSLDHIVDAHYPGGFTWNRIKFHDDYSDISLENMHEMHKHFKKAHDYGSKIDFFETKEDQANFQELLSRNETALLQEYVLKLAQKGIKWIPINEVPLDELEKIKDIYGDDIKKLVLPGTLSIPKSSPVIFGYLGKTMDGIDPMTSYALNPKNGHQVFHNKQRSKRPEAKAKKQTSETPDYGSLEAKDSFLKTHELLTPPELLRVYQDGTIESRITPDNLRWNPEKPYSVRVVPNLVPILPPQAFGAKQELSKDEQEMYKSYLSIPEGREHIKNLGELLKKLSLPTTLIKDYFRKEFLHFVIIEHPELFNDNPRNEYDLKRTGTLTRNEFSHVMKAMIETRVYIESHPLVKYSKLFKNWGGASGASLPHTHSQISGGLTWPTKVIRNIDYLQRNGSNANAKILDFYEQMGFLIARSEDRRVKAYASPWSSFPGTVEIYIRGEHAPRYELLSIEDRAQLDTMSHFVQTAMGDQPYNWIILDTPKDSNVEIPVGWRVNLRSNNMIAGWELFGGDRASSYPPRVFAYHIAEMMKKTQDRYSDQNPGYGIENVRFPILNGNK
ncbi:MAG: DUF4921 family protein [Nanoarchaeota archaeon]|nr:DUF4921 family protein [Nanoarchaeota archaeon]